MKLAWNHSEGEGEMLALDCVVLTKLENKADLLKEIGDLSGSVFTQIILSSIRRFSFTVKMSLKRIKRV